MTRKLVTIQAVKDVLPIEGADNIELVIINGWQVVTQKANHFEPGTLVLFYEIDSFLPASDPRYASFEERFSNWGDKRGMRLKTIKLRKQLSQGLVMPLDEFPEVKDAMADFVHAGCDRDTFIGRDMTDLLRIEKWEPIEKSRRGNQPGSSEGKRFPAFIRKTDQERIQNFGMLAQRAADADEEFEATMKKDGSSMTVFRVDPKSPYYKDAKALYRKKLNWFFRFIDWGADIFNGRQAVHGICSRNVMLPLTGNSNFHKAAEKCDLLFKLDAMGGSYALQGEVLAPDIQDNYEKVKDVEFHLFDIFEIDKQQYMLPDPRQYTAELHSIPHVTTLASRDDLKNILDLQPGDDIVKKALEYAEGPGDNPGVKREGVVFKACGRDFSFKAVSDSYLLKKG